MDVTLSSLAIHNLFGVIEYVTEEFGPKTAQRSYHKLINKIQQLSLFPDIGKIDERLTVSSGRTIRRLTVSPNIVFYMNEGEKIIVIAVLHDSQSYETVRKEIFGFLQYEHGLK